MTKIAALLSLVTAAACAGALDAAPPTEGVDSGVEVKHQEQPEWCWAAAEQAMLQLTGASRAQCDLVSDAFGRDCCSNPSACNGDFHPAGLDGLIEHTSAGLMDVEPLMQVFAAHGAALLRYADAYGAHFIEVTGYGAAAGCSEDEFMIQNSATTKPQHICTADLATVFPGSHVTETLTYIPTAQ